MNRLVLILILLLGTAGYAAQETGANFENANRLFETGKFEAAADAYERILAGGLGSAELFFNLGNARFRAGQIGSAIAAYRQAQELKPRDPDTQANLKFAREQVRGPHWKPSRGEQMIRRLSLDEWSVLASGAVWFLFTILTVVQLKPVWKTGLRVWTWLAAFLTLLALALLVTAWTIQRGQTIAVVTTREAVIKHGPLEESQAAFTTTDGAELLVLDRKDQWLMVSAGRNRTGWLPANAVYLPKPVQTTR